MCNGGVVASCSRSVFELVVSFPFLLTGRAGFEPRIDVQITASEAMGALPIKTEGIESHKSSTTFFTSLLHSSTPPLSTCYCNNTRGIAETYPPAHLGLSITSTPAI